MEAKRRSSASVQTEGYCPANCEVIDGVMIPEFGIFVTLDMGNEIYIKSFVPLSEVQADEMITNLHTMQAKRRGYESRRKA